MTEPTAETELSLDIAIAKEVMGWIGVYGFGEENPLHQFHPSTNDADALEVVRHFQKQGYLVTIDALRDGKWRCSIYRDGGYVFESQPCPTLGQAVCEAALMAVRDGKEGDA